MGAHIALLRGINVGGKNRLPMADLKALFEGAGCTAVRSYIQSGNVVFEATDDLAARIPTLIPEAIERHHGISSPVVTRSAEELAAVVEGNPYLAQGAEPKALHVAYLADVPDAARLAGLDPDRSPGDTFTAVGREIFLHCPNGLARTKLTNAWFDSKLGTVSTVRNWKTTGKLLQMAGM